jgi:Leucine Rich Repeat (LRR) protein
MMEELMHLRILCVAILLLIIHGSPGTSGGVVARARLNGQRIPLSAKGSIVAEVTSLGGRVEFDETRADRPIIKIDLHGTQITDSNLAFLNHARKELPDLRYLDLRLTHIGDAGVFHLRNLTSLTTLNLFRTDLGDAGLASLRKLTQLQTLLIGGTKVTDAGLIHIRRFRELRKLSLFQTQVTDAGIPHLRVLCHLEQLLISGTKITDDGAKKLQKALPKLKFSEQT